MSVTFVAGNNYTTRRPHEGEDFAILLRWRKRSSGDFTTVGAAPFVGTTPAIEAAMRARRVGPQCRANKFYPHFLEQHGEREWMRRSLDRLRAARVAHFQLVDRVRK